MNKIICTVGAPLISLAKIICILIAFAICIGIIFLFMFGLANIPLPLWVLAVLGYMLIGILGSIMAFFIVRDFYIDSKYNYKKCREYWSA